MTLQFSCGAAIASRGSLSPRVAGSLPWGQPVQAAFADQLPWGRAAGAGLGLAGGGTGSGRHWRCHGASGKWIPRLDLRRRCLWWGRRDVSADCCRTAPLSLSPGNEAPPRTQGVENPLSPASTARPSLPPGRAPALVLPQRCRRCLPLSAALGAGQPGQPWEKAGGGGGGGEKGSPQTLEQLKISLFLGSSRLPGAGWTRTHKRR